MPPKAKAKGKGKSTGVEINGVNTADMTREQLEVFALRLKEELEQERTERNFFQLERDKIRTCLKLSQGQLQQAKERLLQQEAAVEAGDQQHEADTKDFQQALRFIEFEHERKVTDVNATATAAMARSGEEFSKEQCVMLRDKTDLKQQVVGIERGNMEELAQMRAEVAVDIENIRARFEQMRCASEQKLASIYQSIHSEIIAVHKMELDEVAERRNSAIRQLEEDHAQFVDELHELYDTVTLNNFAVIDSLKGLIDKLARLNKELQLCIADMKRQNRSLMEPLRRVEREKMLLGIQYEHYMRDQFLLRRLDQQLQDTQQGYERCVESVQTTHKALDELRQERDQMQGQMLYGTRTFRRKVRNRTECHEKHVAMLRARLARRDAVLQPLMATLGCKFRDVEQAIARKDRTIEELRGELTELVTAHDAMVRAQNWKLHNVGAPPRDVGYMPLTLCKRTLN